jgi:hypothetical protein
LERLYPDIPPGPGRVQLRESEYERHGTLCLTANLEIWSGLTHQIFQEFEPEPSRDSRFASQRDDVAG